MLRASFAYMAGGQVHLADGEGKTETLTSPFVEDVRRREASIERKTAWKTKGTGARFMGAAALWDESEGRVSPVHFTFLARGRKPGEILYGLTTGVVSAILAYDCATGNEQRLLHGTGQPIASLATSDDHCVLAFARAQKNGSVNIAVMRDDGGEEALVTDGDTIDDAPSWVPVAREVESGRHQLLYQSTGLGRDASGALAGFGPTEIHLLDAESANLKTLVSEPDKDYLAPQMTRDGAVYALRRPYRTGAEAPNPATVLKDGLFAPFRLMYAGFRYLDFFTMRYTGKPLATSGNTKGRQVDARRLLERQNVDSAGDGEDAEKFRAPAEWVLVKRTPKGDETAVAKSVLAYALDGDAVLVSDGRTVARVGAQGERTELAKLEFVTAMVRV